MGQAGFVGQRTQEVEILLTESDDALLGVGFLMDWRLEIDFSQGLVQLQPRTRKGKKIRSGRILFGLGWAEFNYKNYQLRNYLFCSDFPQIVEITDLEC